MPGNVKKSDRALANWQVMIHTPTSLVPHGKLEKAYQENMIKTLFRLTVSGDTYNVDNLHGGGDDEELDVEIANEFEEHVINEEKSDEGEFVSGNEGSSFDCD